MQNLYIISQRRSGSTLIENLLGQHEQVISVGEFRMLKGHYLKRGPGELWNWKCNCGADIKECAFWAKYYKETENILPETALNYKFGFWQWMQVVFGGASKIIRRNKIKGREIAEYTLKVYQAIEKDFPGTVIVDSSKDALQGYFLLEKSDDVVVLYLKRQLRATVSSKYKRAVMKGKKAGLYKMLFSSFFLEIFNKTITHHIPEKQVVSFTYEEFVEKKEYYYGLLLNKLQITPKPIPEFFKPYHSHSIAGTPSRFEKKSVLYDDSWKQLYSKRPLANFLGIVLGKILG